MPKIFALALESFLIGAFGAGNRMTPHAFHTLEKFRAFFSHAHLFKTQLRSKRPEIFQGPQKNSHVGGQLTPAKPGRGLQAGGFFLGHPQFFFC